LDAIVELCSRLLKQRAIRAFFIMKNTSKHITNGLEVLITEKGSIAIS
jgi:hypothetical protein